MQAAATELTGREAEYDLVREFVAQSPHSRALLLRGEPGIGKTAVWIAAKQLAEAAGARVLSSSAAQLEMPLGLAAIGDLLEPVLLEIGRMPEPQRLALALAAGIEPAAGSTPDRLAICRAFLAALRILAAESPVVIALDDVQWLDTPSVRVLSFALRRLDDEAVCLLATLRGGTDAPDPLDLRNTFADSRRRELVLGPLTRGALSHVLNQRVGGLSRSLLLQYTTRLAAIPCSRLSLLAASRPRQADDPRTPFRSPRRSAT